LVAEFLFRLWVHEAGDGLLPEVVVSAETRMDAAVAALNHFVSIGRPVGLDSYLECEPQAGPGLRVANVLQWLDDTGGDLFWREAARRGPAFLSARPASAATRIDPTTDPL
jgi:hypothetical protein